MKTDRLPRQTLELQTAVAVPEQNTKRNHHVKMQGGTVSYEAIATSLLYAQNSEWMWIFNVLAHYDLPDLSAAAGEHLTKTTLV